jgi:ABC-2 type transport system permease protein
VVSEADRLMAMIYPSLVAMLIYGIILMAGGLLLQSVSNEKKNRVMEVLLLSVTPRRLLTGKMIALGLVGLLQAIIWAGMGAAFFRLPGGPLHLPEGMAPSASLVVWSVIFFLLGYMVYASLMAGAGALIPDIKQSPMVSLIFAAPALIGFEIGVFTGPDNPASVVSSIFPLTAPFTMIDRLASGAVPLGQVLLSIGLQLLTIPLIVFLVARAFQAQHLLSGQPFSMRRYLGVLLGRP